MEQRTKWRTKTSKLLKENLGVNFHDLGLDNGDRSDTKITNNKPLQYFKVIGLQLIKINEKKNNRKKKK